ncbi:hypothetical protein KGQ55_01205 [Patescibacteria group bacterium]|nr:hypothetical protein [Patescibacteria group bacterium]
MDQPDTLARPPLPAPLPAPLPPVSRFEALKARFRAHPRRSAFFAGGILLAVLLIVLVAGAFSGGISFFVPKTNYVQVYTLVNDKISQHGAIIVNLPTGVLKAGAAADVSFAPAIKGQWVDSPLPDAVVFKPDAALDLGQHYEVTLAAASGTLSKDFVVDADPAVESVFPSASAEADLDSAITIVFNRPMVPLTTLSESGAANVPVVITPATPGKFKWISTRTLQFIPHGSLFGSAHYRVSIPSSLVSMDGLSIPAKTYEFTTKALRLDHATADTIVYDQPVDFSFNQPIDLQKTAPEVTITDTATNRKIPAAATYGTKSVWNAAANAYQSVEDRSILRVFPKNTLGGHANVWDFSATYAVSVNTAYPVGGDIALSGTFLAPAVTTTVTASPVLEGVTAQSDKTDLASAALFDPSGTVTLSFYEDIDLGKSSIQAKGLKRVAYGQKCVGGDTSWFSSSNCIKVDDASQLIFTFDPNAFTRGEQVPITFAKLVNAAGFEVNARPFTVNLSAYPALAIVQSVPATGDGNASVSDLVLCTNAPLASEDATTFHKNFHADRYMVFGRWDNPYLETANQYEKNPPCAVGQYVNRIHYGLLPLTPYSLTGTVTDVFGQTASFAFSLKTGPAPKFYLRFQNLQKIYDVTTPGRTTLTYATENFGYADLYLCKVSPEAMVRLLAAQPSEVSTVPDSALPCDSTVTKRIPLTNDQWVNQFFQVNLSDYFADTRGQYVLSFSNPSYTDDSGKPLYARTYLSVTNLSVTDNRVKWTSYDYLPDVPNLTPADTRGSVYWVTNATTLDAVPAASVSVYRSTDPTSTDAPIVRAGTNATDANGFAEFPLIADVAGATVTSGNDTAIISPWADTLSQGSWQSAYQTESTYIYTDRPIYRPGQTVHLKGLYRVNFDGLFQIFRQNDVKVEVDDSRGNVVLTQNVPMNEYGTFTTDLTLPADAPLGTYSISARNGYAEFNVEDYSAAAFEAAATTNKDEYVAGDTADISISGKYYFGVPLNGGTLDYTVTSQDYYFDRYTDRYFSFGSGWYTCYGCGYGDTYLKSGKATLDANGQTSVSLPLDFGSLYQGTDGDRSKIFVFHGTIHDAQGKSVSFEKSFIVHRGEYYLGVAADPSFVGVNQPFNLRLKTVDTSGKPVSESNITVTVNKVDWLSSKRQEVDGGYYNRPDRTLTPVSTKTYSTNGSGDGGESLTLAKSGEYEIDAMGKDSRGNAVKSTTEVYVYGAGNVAVAETNNATLNLTAENPNVKVGDTAKFVIQNPYPHAKALITIERGRIFTYDVVDLTQSIYEYSFPVTAEYAPNVYASVVLLSPDPGVKFGQLEYTVDRAQDALTVNVTTDKQTYLPGEQVNLTVRTTDALGRAVPADVSVAVADLSVLALAGNPKKDPLVFFYDGFPLTVSAETNVKNLLAEMPIPTGTKGGGGGNPADLATHKRGEFKDTAFWQADVITDASGTAHVSFTLPDNLTKWQIESVGITKDTKVGVDYTQVVAQKDVMTVPIAPRFVVPGDEFWLGATIFNQTAQPETLDVSLASPTLTQEGDWSTRKTIPAGGSTAVYFKVLAPLAMTSGTHDFTLSAKNAAYDDTVEQKIPITENTTYESVATEGSTSATSTAEYLYVPGNVLTDRGGLTVRTSATLAVYLTDALQYLFAYPLGCSEQLASKLSAIAIAEKTYAAAGVWKTPPSVIFNGTSYTPDQAVAAGLALVYDNQTVDGGFSYYKGMRADPALTIAVLDSLVTVKSAGYAVRKDVMDAAVRYLYRQVPVYENRGDTDTLILMAYVLSRADAGSAAFSGLLSAVTARANGAYLSDTASSETLGYLALLSAGGGTSSAFKDAAFAALLNRVDIDSRGAYVKPDPTHFDWQYYETSEKDTALLIAALTADHRAYAETDNLIRWLIASRASDGSWGSTNASVAALDALSRYVAWKQETKSDFTLTTKLGGTTVSSTDFTKQNILTPVTAFLPITKLVIGALEPLTFTKADHTSAPDTFYYDLSLKYYLPAEQIAPRDEGVAITRNFYSLMDTADAHPLASVKVGDVVRGVLTIVLPKEHHLFSVEDYIPAGFELVDFNLATEDQTTLSGAASAGADQSAPGAPAPASGSFFSGLLRNIFSGFGFGTAETTASAPGVIYQPFIPDYRELLDDRLFLFAEDVAPGTYSYEYYVRATTAGTFRHLPALASDLYYPEDFGRTAGSLFTVSQ